MPPAGSGEGSGVSLDDLLEEKLRRIVREEIRAILPNETPRAPEEYLTISQVSKELHVSRPTVREWIEHQEIKGYMAGNSIRIKRSELEAYLARDPKRSDLSRMAARIISIERERGARK